MCKIQDNIRFQNHWNYHPNTLHILKYVQKKIPLKWKSKWDKILFRFSYKLFAIEGADNWNGQMKSVLQNRFQFWIRHWKQMEFGFWKPAQLYWGQYPSYLELQWNIPLELKVLEFIIHSCNTSYLHLFTISNPSIFSRHHGSLMQSINTIFTLCLVTLGGSKKRRITKNVNS